MVNFELFFQT